MFDLGLLIRLSIYLLRSIVVFVVEPDVREPCYADEVYVIGEGARREHCEPLDGETGNIKEVVVHPELFRRSLEDAIYLLGLFLWRDIETVYFIEALLRDLIQLVVLHLSSP